MPTSPTLTRATLLMDVRDGGNAQAWARFEALYRPMMVRYARSRGMQHADAEDVAQSVLSRLVTGIRNFEYDPAKGRFRDYLFRCVRSGIADRCPGRRPATVVHSGAHTAGEPDEAMKGLEQEWIAHHYRLALQALRMSSSSSSIDVLTRSLDGRTLQQIAAELGMSVDAVTKARQRMKDRLRRQINRQVQDEDRLEFGETKP